MTHEQRPGFGKGRCMIYYDTVKRQLTQQELDGNFEQLMLRAKKLGAQDMPITLRKDLTRPLTPREMDTNFQSLDLAVKKARYGDGPYPAAEYIFDGATVLPAGIAFSRSSEATYIKNGRLLTAGVDEPVFENGGFRVWPSVTNLIPTSDSFFDAFPVNASKVWSEVGVGRGVFGLPEMTFTPTFVGFYSHTRDLDLQGTKVGFVFIGRTSSEQGAVLVYPRTSSEWDGVAYYEDGTTEVLTGVMRPHLSRPDAAVCIVGTVRADEVVNFGFNRGQTDSGSFLHEGETFGFSHFGVYANDAVRPFLYVPTHGQPETMPADNARIEGAAFSNLYNPNQGALVLPHSSFGEGGIITLGGLNIARTEDGLELNSTAIPNTEDAKQNLKLRWGSNGLDVFVGNTKALHDIPLPANWGDADSLVLADNDSAGKYIDRLAMLTEAPTDEQMEALTNA